MTQQRDRNPDGQERRDASRWGGVLAALGGLLWIPYGIFEMTEPWGRDTVYTDEQGYEIIIDTSLFVLYSLPGALALLLTALGLLSLLPILDRGSTRRAKAARLLGVLAALLGGFSILGVVILFDPLFTAPRIFGTLALGAATLVAGLAGRTQRGDDDWTRGLVILGMLGVFLLPLWPLVHAVQWLPEIVGAAMIGFFGIGWMIVGYRLSTSQPSTVVRERGAG